MIVGSFAPYIKSKDLKQGNSIRVFYTGALVGDKSGERQAQIYEVIDNDEVLVMTVDGQRVRAYRRARSR